MMDDTINSLLLEGVSSDEEEEDLQLRTSLSSTNLKRRSTVLDDKSAAKRDQERLKAIDRLRRTTVGVSEWGMDEDEETAEAIAGQYQDADTSIDASYWECKLNAPLAFAIKMEDADRVRAVVEAFPDAANAHYCVRGGLWHQLCSFPFLLRLLSVSRMTVVPLLDTSPCLSLSVCGLFSPVSSRAVGPYVEQNGNTGLHLCASGGDQEKAIILLEAGAKLTALNESGHTPLHVAVHNNRANIARLFLAYGADANAVDALDGATPLVLACKFGSMEIVELLVSHGADVNAMDMKEKRSCLLHATTSLSTDIMEYLIQNGADVNAKDANGASPLLFAYYVDDYEAVDLLLRHGADIRVRCNLGLGAIHVAAVDGRVGTVRKVIADGGDVDETGDNGMSPLHYAAWYGMEASIEALLELGANVNALDKTKMTPLHWAAKSMRMKSSELLVKAGADLHLKDEWGHTPLYYGFLSGAHTTVIHLLENGAEFKNLSLPAHARLRPPGCAMCHDAACLIEWIKRATHVDMSVIRLMVLGHGRAGKSTMIHSLHAVAQRTWKMKVLSKKPPPIESLQSSVGVDIFQDTLKLHDKIQFSIWDFAGQLEYLPMHQYFLCETNSVYLVVVDVSQSAERIEEHLTHWLGYMEDTLPILQKGKGRLRYVVQVVGSQGDKLSKNDAEAVRSRISDISSRFRLPLAAEPVIVSGRFHNGVEELLERVVSMAKYLLSERMQQYIPQEYSDAIDRLRGLVETQSIPLVTTQSALAQELQCDDDCIEFLRVLGLTVGAEEMVCVQPQVLAKILSSFVCESEDHVQSLLRAGSHSLKESKLGDAAHRIKFGVGRAVVREETCLELISAVLDSITTVNRQKEDVRFLLRALESFRLCFRLSSRYEHLYGHGGYLFPSLLPEGELFVIPYTPPCLVPTGATPQSAWQHRGVRWSALGEVRLTQRDFLNVLVRAFDIHDPGSKLYGNGFLIRDYEEAEGGADTETRTRIGTVTLKSLNTLNRGVVVWERHTIVCVVHGPDPLPLLARLKNHLTVDAALELRTEELAEEVIFKHLGNMQWAPMGCKEFYSVGEWRTLSDAQKKEYGVRVVPGEEDGPVPLHPQPGLMPNYLGLQMTDLSFHEADEWRRREFERVRKWFYSFVGKDRRKDFRLDRVVFLHNTHRERQFLACYNEMIERAHRSDRVQLSDMTLQQRRTLEYLSQYQGRVSGAEQVNLVLAWHANTQSRLFQSASNGVWVPKPLTKEQKKNLEERKPVDYGFYGRGFYLTQYPSYGNYYLETVRQLPAGTPLLLSWTLLGNVYPATEDPGGPNAMNLHGKPCKKGFDSHYALVTKPNYIPTPLDQEPDADELIVFRKEQVLPRYLVFYSRTSPALSPDSPAPSGVDQSEAVASSDAAEETRRKLSATRGNPTPAGDGPMVLWVDPRPHSKVNVRVVKAVEGNTSVRFSQSPSTEEAQVWIEQNKEALRTLISRNLFRIMTNRRRRESGGAPDQAGARFIHWVRNDPMLANVPVMLFCGRVDHRVASLQKPPKTFVTDDVKEAISFASLDPLPSSDQRGCSVQ